MIVVADTSPIRYLVLVEAVHVLPRMFESVLIPPAVVAELTHPRCPEPVRTWASAPPTWLSVQGPTTDDPTLNVDPGEYEAIQLAVERRLPVLMDDWRGRTAAAQRGVPTIGTLILLFDAGGIGLVDFTSTVRRLLNETNFRAPAKLLQTLFDRDAVRRR